MPTATLDRPAPVIITPQPGYLSPDEAAAYTGLSVSGLRSLIRDRHLPASQLVKHGRILIARADIDAFIAANRIDAEAGDLDGH